MSSIPSLEWECFLTHDWGTKEDGHANHKRVGEVYRALKAVGFNNWFDDVAMLGDITSAMRKGIVLLFLSQSGIYKKSIKKTPAIIVFKSLSISF